MPSLRVPAGVGLAVVAGGGERERKREVDCDALIVCTELLAKCHFLVPTGEHKTSTVPPVPYHLLTEISVFQLHGNLLVLS